MDLWMDKDTRRNQGQNPNRGAPEHLRGGAGELGGGMLKVLVARSGVGRDASSVHWGTFPRTDGCKAPHVDIEEGRTIKCQLPRPAASPSLLDKRTSTGQD